MKIREIGQISNLTEKIIMDFEDKKSQSNDSRNNDFFTILKNFQI